MDFKLKFSDPFFSLFTLLPLPFFFSNWWWADSIPGGGDATTALQPPKYPAYLRW